MSKRIRVARRVGTLAMLACFALAIAAAVVAALAAVIDGDLTVAGVGIGTTGVWFALGFFFYAESSRQEFEGCLEERLDDVFERLGKCECKCQTDAVD